jgi:hypothetical protein
MALIARMTRLGDARQCGRAEQAARHQLQKCSAIHINEKWIMEN